MAFDHGAPVEALLVVPSGTVVYSAGEKHVCSWDFLAAGRMLRHFGHHQKTVTSLALDSTGRRLLVGSLDHRVKIYDTALYRTLFCFRFHAPVLSVGLSVRTLFTPHGPCLCDSLRCG